MKPDTLASDTKLHGTNAFVTTLVAFFFVEMGDKTQLATVGLSARFHALWEVVLGTTLGMVLANVPAVWIGERLATRLPMHAIRIVAAVLFILIGAVTLLGPARELL